MNDAVFAGLMTALGAAILAVVNYFLNRGKTRLDVATQIREELRKDNAQLRQEIRDVQKDLVEWKNKCYELLKRQGELQVENSDMKADIIRLTQILKDHNIAV